MEFSSFFFHLLFFGQIFQFSNTIVSSTKVEISVQNAPIDKLDSLTEQIPSFDSFARTFNNSHPTDADRMAQIEYYLVKALQTLNSVIRHKKHNSTSNLTNNEMSDLSPAEVKQQYMSRDTREKGRSAAIELAEFEDDDVDYEEVEVEVEDEKDADIEKRLVQQRIKRGLTSSWKKMFGGKGKKGKNSKGKEKEEDNRKGKEKEEEKEINKNLVYIDHRQSGCLAQPRNQRRCRASYAFATIAFYEWLNCKKTGVFKAFSEQYIIDCGYITHGLGGCNGGNLAGVVGFVKDCGVIFGGHYPFTGRRGNCPYDIFTPHENMGHLRIYEQNANRIPLNQQSLEEHLEYGPIIVVVEISNEFYAYTGLVDDNVGHTPELLHTMLLIGHGIEDGVDYWLFRNSYSALPLYKLNKNVDCFSGEFGFGLRVPLADESGIE